MLAFVGDANPLALGAYVAHEQFESVADVTYGHMQT